MCVCACACVRVCVHAEPILLNPVPHCLNTSLESFHCQSLNPVFSFGGGWFLWREWQAGWVCRQSGPLIGPLHAGETNCPFSEVFCERIWSGGPHRDVMFQVYSLKRGHMRWLIFFFFPVAATFKSFLFLFLLHIPVVSDRALLPSDLLLMTVALVTHTDTRPGRNRTETHFQQSWKFTSFYVYMKFNSGRRVDSFFFLNT